MTWIEFFQVLRNIYEFLASTLFILTICLVSGLLKFKIIREYFDLNNFFFQYKNWINICFFISVIYLFVKLFYEIYKKINTSWLAHIAKINVLKELDTLNEEEKKILESLVFNNVKTIPGPIFDPAFSSLVAKGILFRADAGYQQHAWAHIIYTFVWKKIKKDPRFKKDNL